MDSHVPLSATKVTGAALPQPVRRRQAGCQAGAAFAISPGATPTLLTAGASGPIPYLPAVATASELMHGLDAGLTRFKFFPAENAGGPAMFMRREY